jgi:PBP1b-binding outer membrane lipoprotein LpoB
MKRIFVIMIAVCAVIILLFFSSCNSKYKEDESNRIIRVNTIKEQELELSDIVSQIKILPLETKRDESIIGQIKDICFVDDAVYILDMITQSILAFDMNTGKFIKRVRNTGQGPNEYMQPVALASYAEHVYLLDINGLIVCYDKQLNPVETIRLTFTPHDLIAVADGFYLYNISSANLNKVVYANKKGRVMDSYISASKTDFNRKFTISKSLTNANNGDIYFTDFTASLINKFFRISKDKVVSCQVDFGKDNIPADFDINGTNLIDFSYACLAEHFPLNSCNVISFFKREMRYYCFHDLSTGKQQTGSLVHNKYDIPFFPRWQFNSDILVGVCHYHSIEANFDNIRNYFIADLDKDDVDDEEMSFLLFYDFTNMKIE